MYVYTFFVNFNTICRPNLPVIVFILAKLWSGRWEFLPPPPLLALTKVKKSQFFIGLKYLKDNISQNIQYIVLIFILITRHGIFC